MIDEIKKQYALVLAAGDVVERAPIHKTKAAAKNLANQSTSLMEKLIGCLEQHETLIERQGDKLKVLESEVNELKQQLATLNLQEVA